MNTTRASSLRRGWSIFSWSFWSVIPRFWSSSGVRHWNLLLQEEIYGCVTVDVSPSLSLSAPNEHGICLHEVYEHALFAMLLKIDMALFCVLSKFCQWDGTDVCNQMSYIMSRVTWYDPMIYHDILLVAAGSLYPMIYSKPHVRNLRHYPCLLLSSIFDFFWCTGWSSSIKGSRHQVYVIISPHTIFFFFF